MLRFPAHVHHAEIAVHLMARIRDEEESIRRLVVRTFAACWFNADSELMRTRVATHANGRSSSSSSSHAIVYSGAALWVSRAQT